MRQERNKVVFALSTGTVNPAWPVVVDTVCADNNQQVIRES